MKRDTFELIQALEGSIEPYAETHVDKKHLANLKERCELHERITDEIAKFANTSNLRCYYSARLAQTKIKATFYLKGVEEEQW